MEKWTEETRQRIIQQISMLSDKGEDQEEYALESFYDYNLTPHLMKKTNQIIRGSRGMGKTHILKVLERTLSKKVDKTIKRDIKAHYNAKTGKMKLQIE